jgi:hypothetical protein
MKFKILSEEEKADINSKESLNKLSEERAKTDEADKYIVYHHRKFDKNNKYGWALIPVLQDLWGRPWNNAALSFIRALRPSYVRVITDAQTCDACVWRVTVHLEKDNRTIRDIEQEVEVDLRGYRNGEDAKNYLNKKDEFLKNRNPLINPNATLKLK